MEGSPVEDSVTLFKGGCLAFFCANGEGNSCLSLSERFSVKLPQGITAGLKLESGCQSKRP